VSAAVPQVHPLAGGARELKLELRMGEEDERLNPRQPDVLRRLLPLEQRGELARLAVGEEERVVIGMDLAVLVPHPGPHISLQGSRPALDLDQVEPLGCQHQEVYLVETPALGPEFEVRPGAVGFVVGQPLAHEGESLPFPGILGSAHWVPAWRRLVQEVILIYQRAARFPALLAAWLRYTLWPAI
jgi:hypothetical protein